MINHALQKKLEELRLNGHALERLYMRVFNSEDGKLVLEDLRTRGFIFVPTHSERDEGKRELILHIETMINPVPVEEAPKTNNEPGDMPEQGEMS